MMSSASQGFFFKLFFRIYGRITTWEKERKKRKKRMKEKEKKRKKKKSDHIVIY